MHRCNVDAVDITPRHAVFTPKAEFDVVFTYFGGVTFFDPAVVIFFVVSCEASVVED